MIIESYMIGNTRINIDDEYKTESEEERKIHIENFNRIGNEILRNINKNKGE